MKSFILYVIRSYKKDRVSIFAAQASFFIIVSAVPFAAMILSVIGVIMPLLADNFSELIMRFIPSTLSGTAEAILKENQDKVAKEQKDLEELREKKSGVIRSLEEITADIQRLSDKIKASGK